VGNANRLDIVRGRSLRRRILAVLPLLALLLAPSPGGTVSAQAFDYQHLTKLQKRLLSGLADLELRAGPGGLRANEKPHGFTPRNGRGCGGSYGANIKVNQNCMNLSDSDLAGRGQAANEPSIAQDANAPAHLVASFNDYRGGEGTCATAYSRDGGQTWQDSVVPANFTRGTSFGAAREYWQTGGDGTVAFDSRGNVYLACQRFQRGPGESPSPDLSSGVYVFRSTGNGGASWNFPGRPVVESADVAGSGAAPFEDKPVLTVDGNPASPYRDRIYVTYTEFSWSTGILTYESYSDDYGEHFSPRVLVFNPGGVCPNSFFGPAGDCDAGIDGQPFVGPDGTLYVVQNNFNNYFYDANDNHNQVILARSTDGGRSFSQPVKVADYYDLPDCATYQQGQDLGRSCVPEKNPASAASIFRAINYPVGAVNPTNPKQVVVSFGSYINPHSNESSGCFPAYFADDALNTYNGVKAPGGCNNDILLSVSSDGGLSFDGASVDPRRLTSVTQALDQASTDQFWQWAGFDKQGSLAVSYYDRQYGSDEASGFSDVSVSVSSDLNHYAVARATSSSMPPPSQFEGTFYGDYAGLSAWDGIHAIWADTRDAELFLCPGTGTVGSPPQPCSASAASGSLANNQEIFSRQLR
jgi:hypothetical protein